MFRPKVMSFSGSPRQGTIERKLPRYVLILSGIGAVGSIAGWIWTYIQPAAFTAHMGNGDGSLFNWVPQFPLIGVLGVMALVVRLFTEGPTSRRTGAVFSRMSRLFEVGVWDVPFIAGFLVAGMCYLPPVFSAVLTLGPAANSSLIGLGIARFCLSVLTISHLGHAAYIGCALWNRRGLPR